MYQNVIRSIEELRERLGRPNERVVKKEQPALDRYSRAFIALSPFFVMATCSASGADATPRGDAPGFVQVPDDTHLLIPERPGNRRFDSLSNILDTGAVGLLFMVPGFEETLRVNGTAEIVCDEDVLASLAHEGKPAQAALVVTVQASYFHCAKAFRRSRLWHPDAAVDRASFPSLGEILMHQTATASAEDIERNLAEDYKNRLY